MNTPFSRQQGFTLVELLIVFSLIALVGTFLIVGFLNYANYQRFVAAGSEVSTQLREARQRTLAAENDTTYGVRFDTTTITSFSGSSYSVGDPSNVVTDVYGATLSTDLSLGVAEIVFDRKTGAASATGTIVIASTNSTTYATVTVSGTGLVQ